MLLLPDRRDKWIDARALDMECREQLCMVRLNEDIIVALHSLDWP